MLLHSMSSSSRAIAVASFGVLAAFGSSTPLRAAEAPASVTPDAMGTGSLLIKTDRGLVVAPRIKTDVDVTVSGPTARARVTQIFRNPTKRWVEGVYVYPLPEGAAVDTMKMVVGSRVIVADVAERKQARETYERAKAAGQAAALTEQERPNIFTNSVSNLGPGESVVVQVEYQEPVGRDGERFSLRVPLVVAPRYNPAPVPMAQQAEFNGAEGGWGTAADPVPDRDRITPPVADPNGGGAENPVTLAVHLQAGFPLANVTSPTHALSVTGEGAGRDVAITGANQADRDFELDWTPVASASPTVGLFREHVGADDYLLAYLTPPSAGPAQRQPRDVTFVIDNSGSMQGPSMAGAKASLAYALDRLHPEDRFNVIRFDDTMSTLFPASVPADQAHLDAARRFVDGIEARGGTEMLAPMRAALIDPNPGDITHLRQVVFLTDGEIGNESDIFDAIAHDAGRTRLFTVGIGAAPNGFLMRRAAELGRGSYTAIPTVDAVRERMQALTDKLEAPSVTDLKATVSSGSADITPMPVPDLYRGEPLVLAAKLEPRAGGDLTITGRLGDRPWSLTLPVDRAAPGTGLSKVWARRKIDDAEMALVTRRLSSEAADRTILGLALSHHLVTRLTSLVAVDTTPSRPAGAPLSRQDVPLLLPAGWSFDSVFGKDGIAAPQIRAESGEDQFDPRGFDGLRGRPGPQKLALASPAAPDVTLPQTGTDAPLRLVAGLSLLLAGLLGLARRFSAGEVLR